MFLQIKVAVSADRDCVRSYHPEIRSTNFNTLTLNVKTSEPDNLLFYMGSNTKVRLLLNISPKNVFYDLDFLLPIMLDMLQLLQLCYIVTVMYNGFIELMCFSVNT